jgi:hypothetical protein
MEVDYGQILREGCEISGLIGDDFIAWHGWVNLRELSFREICDFVGDDSFLIVSCWKGEFKVIWYCVMHLY